MKTKCMSCGGTTKKMQKGGSTDSTRTAPYVSPKGAFYPDKKSLESGCAKNPNSPECKKVIKTMSLAEAAKIKGRLQKGGAIKKMQNGGFPITAKAAARKVAKGKGMMTYNYGTKDVPGSDGNKGAYVKFAKNQEPNPYGGKTLQGRSRRVMKKGGVKK